MANPSFLPNALCLPAPDIAALEQGRMVAAIPQVFINPGRFFALYPSTRLLTPLSVEQSYRPVFRSIAQESLAKVGPETITVSAYARCESCPGLDKHANLANLSALTIWTVEGLQQILSQSQFFFLAYLRVYKLPEPIHIPLLPEHQQNIGKFVPLPEALTIRSQQPVLSNDCFAQRKQQLENLEPAPYPKLEQLEAVLAPLAKTDRPARELDRDLRRFLGWADLASEQVLDSDLAWIHTITQVGNSSDGNTFEKLTRKALIKLGFTNTNQNPRASLDPEATGGAGGLDVYCEQPFPLVGECKASQHESVPNSVSAQLIHLGNTHLGRTQFEQSIKIIFAAGALTDHAEKAARENYMNVVRPETLQRLVEMKAQYPGAIDLFDLKDCLEEKPFGTESDDKVNEYIDKVWQHLEVRSHLVEAVKQLSNPDRTQIEVIEIRAHYNAKFAELCGVELDDQTTHELLIELASPLTGYLGRVRGTSLRSDRFYFLREMK